MPKEVLDPLLEESPSVLVVVEPPVLVEVAEGQPVDGQGWDGLRQRGLGAPVLAGEPEAICQEEGSAQQHQRHDHVQQDLQKLLHRGLVVRGDGVEVLLAAQENLVTHDGHRGVEAIVEGVRCEDLKLRAVSDHERVPVPVGDVETIGHTHG